MLFRCKESRVTMILLGLESDLKRCNTNCYSSFGNMTGAECCPTLLTKLRTLTTLPRSCVCVCMSSRMSCMNTVSPSWYHSI